MNIRIIVSSFVFVLSFSLVVPAFAGASARIVSLDGDVNVRESASADPRAARSGETLEAGAWVVTGAFSSCELALGEAGQNAVKIQPKTSARIISLDPGRIDLTNGKLLAIVRKSPAGSSFQIGTPVAIASARGTIFTASPDTFEAIEDAIVLKPLAGGDETVLEEGNSAFFEDGAFRVDPLSAETIADAKQEAKKIEDSLEAGSGGTDMNEGDVLDDVAAGDDVHLSDIEDVIETRSEGAELAKEKDRLEDKKAEGPADSANNSVTPGP